MIYVDKNTYTDNWSEDAKACRRIKDAGTNRRQDRFKIRPPASIGKLGRQTGGLGM